jgi:hypothetical protein
MEANAGALAKPHLVQGRVLEDYSAREARIRQTKNFRKYLPKALYCHQIGVFLPCNNNNKA